MRCELGLVTLKLLDEQVNHLRLCQSFTRSFHEFFATGKQGTKAILNHVLSSVAREALDNFAPLVTIFKYKFEDCQILMNCPLSTFDVLVEVVKPMLPALFGSFEVFSFCLEEENH